jgi:periplasmic divalent cation tolerance protein
MDQFVVVFVSVGSEEEGLAISRRLVEERLAACVNLVPKVRSIYRWEGKICDEPESYLIIKTRQELFEPLQERIKGLHSYSVPEIIALPIVKGLDSYLEWIRAETGSR